MQIDIQSAIALGERRFSIIFQENDFNRKKLTGRQNKQQLNQILSILTDF